MDQLICASLSHTHYWYEVGMLKYRKLLIVGVGKSTWTQGGTHNKRSFVCAAFFLGGGKSGIKKLVRNVVCVTKRDGVRDDIKAVAEHTNVGYPPHPPPPPP